MIRRIKNSIDLPASGVVLQSKDKIKVNQCYSFPINFTPIVNTQILFRLK